MEKRVEYNGETFGKEDRILWGSHEGSDTRIYWEGDTGKATVWGNVGPMPADGGFEQCLGLAQSWELVVFDAAHGPFTD